MSKKETKAIVRMTERQLQEWLTFKRKEPVIVIDKQINNDIAWGVFGHLSVGFFNETDGMREVDKIIQGLIKEQLALKSDIKDHQGIIKKLNIELSEKQKELDILKIKKQSWW